ncbi:Rieske (2Fe-2S) protein [Noviherbaspirillum sp. Root189]|uniref:Rieske (2Fe-2S) protein n=1 Tax=Noviherbaspirillum sp. Root189 TaxID=1736487 RepID=UPI00070CAB88|nr:Rieske (2Fe-2S) protein [Noviherbaspirillum sp. Root189]KRB93566.1 hypothetical protein ASE07_12795 [Noviherbaspirillum sp. Root189]
MTAIGFFLCMLNDIPDGASRGFDPGKRGRDSILMVRRGQRIFAYRDSCPHYGNDGPPMPWRKDDYLNKGGTRILCSAHGAEFEIETGKCTYGPCIGLSLQALPTVVTPEGEIYIVPDRMA